jgi:hypothetical protein
MQPPGLDAARRDIAVHPDAIAPMSPGKSDGLMAEPAAVRAWSGKVDTGFPPDHATTKQDHDPFQSGRIMV